MATAENKPGKKKAKAPKKIGRPSKFTNAIADEICRRLYEDSDEEGGLPESLRQICKDPDMPNRETVRRWLNDENKKDFSGQYAHARELRKDALIDKLYELSRNAINHANGMPGTGEAGARVQAIKLEIDVIKWIISKEYPREYGERIRNEHTGEDGAPIRTSQELSPELQEQILARTAEAAGSAAKVTEPASFRGNGKEE